MLTLIIIFFITRFRKQSASRQLKWQQYLVSKGIGFRTKILEIIEEKCSAQGYKKICIRAMMHVDGKTVCCKMHTLVKEDNIPFAGDKVLIRYMPHQLNRVLVNYPAA